MKTKLVLAAGILATGLISTQATAQESAIESFISNILEQAVTVASAEIENNVRQSVANATYNFSIEGKANSGSVSVTDLASRNEANSSDDANMFEQ